MTPLLTMRKEVGRECIALVRRLSELQNQFYDAASKHQADEWNTGKLHGACGIAGNMLSALAVMLGVGADAVSGATIPAPAIPTSQEAIPDTISAVDVGQAGAEKSQQTAPQDAEEPLPWDIHRTVQAAWLALDLERPNALTTTERAQRANECIKGFTKSAVRRHQALCRLAEAANTTGRHYLASILYSFADRCAEDK